MKKHQKRRYTKLVVFAFLSLATWLAARHSEAQRAVEVMSQWAGAVGSSPKVVFTFDVSSRALYERTRPLMAKHDMSAVVYAETAQLNSGESWVMSWAQLQELQDVHGWEVGSHTINHPYLTQVSNEQLERELKEPLDELVRHGLRVKSFATPYGAYDLRVLAAIAKYYESHRAAWGGPNFWPYAYDDYRIRCYELVNTVSVDQARQWIDDAVEHGQTLVFLMHEIVSTDPTTYEYREEDLDAILAYVATRPLEVTTMTDALRYATSNNLVGNSSFTSVSGGWASGWRQSDSANITVDTSQRGNVSGPTNSVKIVGGASARQLTSGIIAVDPSADYVLRMYENVQDHAAGGWAVWIDEFGAGGAWQTGQWLGGNYGNHVGNRYYEYRPSAGIASMGITIYTEPNSGLTLYLDSVELKRVN